jgi:hypothetical protein
MHECWILYYGVYIYCTVGCCLRLPLVNGFFIWFPVDFFWVPHNTQQQLYQAVQCTSIVCHLVLLPMKQKTCLACPCTWKLPLSVWMTIAYHWRNLRIISCGNSLFIYFYVIQFCIVFASCTIVYTLPTLVLWFLQFDDIFLNNSFRALSYQKGFSRTNVISGRSRRSVATFLSVSSLRSQLNVGMNRTNFMIAFWEIGSVIHSSPNTSWSFPGS